MHLVVPVLALEQFLTLIKWKVDECSWNSIFTSKHCFLDDLNSFQVSLIKCFVSIRLQIVPLKLPFDNEKLYRFPSKQKRFNSLHVHSCLVVSMPWYKPLTLSLTGLATKSRNNAFRIHCDNGIKSYCWKWTNDQKHNDVS